MTNCQPASAFQNRVGSSDRFLGMNGVVQCLAQNRQIDTVFGNRRIFDVTKSVFEILYSVFFCQPPTEFDHLRRIIDGDDLACVFRQQLRKRSLPRTQIGDRQRRK